MAYDIARGQTIVFGGHPGTSGTAAHSDTWSFDGTDWTQVEDIGPSPRTSHAAAYDSDRQRLVLFGGFLRTGMEVGLVNDTWEWNGATWTQMEATGTSARQGHALAYDSSRKTTILFGGENTGEGLVNDTWEWDGNTWTMIGDTGPTTGTTGGFILDGGVSLEVGSLGDTWRWSSGSWSKIREFGPPPRSGHALSYDSERNRIVSENFRSGPTPSQQPTE